MNLWNHLCQFGIDLARKSRNPFQDLRGKLFCNASRRIRYADRVGRRYALRYERQNMFRNHCKPSVVAINVANGDVLVRESREEVARVFRDTYGDKPMYLFDA